MIDEDVDGLDDALKNITGLLDQVRGKLGDRFLRLELADHLAPKSTPLRVPSGLGGAIDKRIAPAGMDALHLFRAIRDVNKDVPDNPDKIDAVVAAIGQVEKIDDPPVGRGRATGRVQIILAAEDAQPRRRGCASRGCGGARRLRRSRPASG